MGNSFLSVQTQEIKMKNGDPFQIITKQLQGKKNFSKIPSKDEIDKQFNDWLKQTLLEQREKDQIQQLDLKYKFRICQLYSKYVQDKLAEIEKEKKIKIEITKQLVQKLLSEQSEINLNQLLNNFREPQYIQEKIQILKQYSIVLKLLIKLQKLEEQSRIQKKYREQITILEFFEILLQSKAGRDVLQVDGFFQILFSNFHPIETKITGITLKILSGSRGLSWEQGCVQLILDAMLNFQKNYKLLNRFDILVRTIYVSKNLIMVYLIIKFLFKFLYSLDNQEVDYVVKEFFDSRVNDKKVDEIFRQIKQRIQKKLYKKEDCTFGAVKKQLQQFELPLASENQEQPLTSRFRTIDLQPTQIAIDEQSLQLEKPEILKQDFKNDSYYYFETGQDQIFIGIQQIVLESINAIQSISQLLDENQESFIIPASQLNVVDFYYNENSTI